MPDCSVVEKSWGELSVEELYAILKLRTDVFFVEQRIDEEELDGRDLEPATRHFFIEDGRGVAAYLRVIAGETTDTSGRPNAPLVLGRVVVRADRRGEGLAQVLIGRAVERFGAEPLILHSQEYVQRLYASFGFEPVGLPYVEAGLPHQSMRRPGRPAGTTPAPV